MQNIKTMPLIAMIIMAFVSFSNLLGLNIAGISVLIGIPFFFINKAFEKQPSKLSGLDIKEIGTNFKDKKIWIWLALPLISIQKSIISVTSQVRILIKSVNYKVI